jgi:hypothetical protein
MEAMELVKYNAAKAALAVCANIDECNAWADKAAALAAYGKQVNDNELEINAKRIRARALRRIGELMKEIPLGKRGPKLIDASVKKQMAASQTERLADAAAETSRAKVAREARISERRQATALQIANLPVEEFEAAVEADKPATIKTLAERGRKKRKRKPRQVDETFEIGRAIKEFEKWWTRWRPHVGRSKGVESAVMELTAALREWR